MADGRSQTATDTERPWYTTFQGAALRMQKHLFRSDELMSALRTYRYVRRDLPPDYRIDLRWMEEGMGPHGQPFDGQLWKGDQLLVQEGGRTVAVLLRELRASSVALDPPLEW